MHPLILVALKGVPAVVLAAAKAERYFLRQRALRGQGAVETIAALVPGTVATVEGVVTATGSLLPGPLTQTQDAVWVCFGNLERQPRGDVRSEREFGGRFAVEDETGSIDVEFSSLTRVVDACEKDSRRVDDASLDHFFETVGLDHRDLYIGRDPRIAYFEIRIREGARVRVTGLIETATHLDSSADGFRQAPTRMTLRGPSDGDVIVRVMKK